MRVKLDENLGMRGAGPLRTSGCNVATVLEQALCSATDSTLAEVCRAESRVLITLDLDFANTLRFAPRLPAMAFCMAETNPSLARSWLTTSPIFSSPRPRMVFTAPSLPSAMANRSRNGEA